MNQNSYSKIRGRPYKPDTKRELWSKSTDFLYVSLGHAMKIDLVTYALPFMLIRTNVWSMLLYLLSVTIFVVPIFLLQSFLGQFSSSSYISVFRIAPTFKGIGYVSLLLNYTLIAYQSIFAGIPLLLLLYTFRWEMPWSCTGYEQWAQNNAELRSTETICNNDTSFRNNLLNEFPSFVLIRAHFQLAINDTLSFSWTIFLCLLVIWTLVAIIVRQSTPVFGRIIRYLVWIAIGILLICLIRSLLLPGSLKALSEYFQADFKWTSHSLLMPVVAAITFSTGWGFTIAMASFNKFKTNIVRYSWLICYLQVLVIFLLDMFTYLMDEHLKTTHKLSILDGYSRQNWEIMLNIPTALADFELPNLWCFLFFIMSISAALVILSTQLYGLISALLDEFPTLRYHRDLLTFDVVLSLAVFSLFFCFNQSSIYVISLQTDSLFLQTALNLLLLLIVLWIYGRVRFQKDFEFMLGRPFSTWLVYLLRFITPICGLAVLFFCYITRYWQHTISIDVVFVLVIILPWLFLPGYTIVNLLQTTGSFCMRIRRIIRPTNWYPLQADDRQRYLDMLENLNMSQQLRAM